LDCTRRHTPSTNVPTQEMNPDRNELNGKVPTRQQYANWMIPVSITYNKNPSMIFNFWGVFSQYSSFNLARTVNKLALILAGLTSRLVCRIDGFWKRWLVG
jgi:hypothetical protein